MIPPPPRAGSAHSGAGQKEPVVLRDVVRKLMKELAPAVDSAVNCLEHVEELWNKVVGNEIARLTRVIRFRGGVLTVEVSSSPLKAELQTFAREQLIAELNTEGLRGIHDLRFRG